MHLIFNSINVLLSYASPEQIPERAVVAFMALGITGFIVVSLAFFSKNRVNLLGRSRLKRRLLITKEGYVTVGICLAVIVYLL